MFYAAIVTIVVYGVNQETGYWEAVKRGTFGDEWWYDNLRMKRETFAQLCSELQPHLSKKMSHFRTPVAVTLWRLATNVEYRTISVLFGLGISTVCTIVQWICAAIAIHLLPRYICIPSERNPRTIINVFETLWGFPQVVGAVDGSHIPILKPQGSPSDYFNCKGFYSIVNSSGKFIDVTIGWPGKVHDARVLVNSTFYQHGMAGQFLLDWKRTIEGEEIPLLILGDPAYPLLTWLMKPYSETSALTPEQ